MNLYATEMSRSDPMIKFLDLQKINSAYAEELKRAADEVIDSGWYLLGDRVKQFESHLAKYVGVKHAIGVASGLDALRLILKAYRELGVMAEGDEVLVPANTFIASILAITDNRLKPVLVEPDLQTCNLDVSLIERHITPRTKAIMVVHLYGRTCWSEELESVAKRHHLKIIEDNAQAIGATYLDPQSPLRDPALARKTGALGDAAGFSFYPGKNLGALGDAGAVTTQDDRLAEIVRALGNYGCHKKYVNDYQGVNSRIDEIQAAFLSVKLAHIDEENQRRREIAEYYCNHIQNPMIRLPGAKNSALFTAPFSGSHVWHLFVIRHPQRDQVQQYLAENDIQTMIHYPIPPHLQKAYAGWHVEPGSLPVTEEIARTCISLPLWPGLGGGQMEEVVSCLNRFVE